MKFNIQNLKRSLGYGALKKEDSMLEELKASGAVRAKFGFDSVISDVVTSLLMQIIEPWIQYCFSKYTEQDFHKRMAAGFDFIDDWKKNHPGKYWPIVTALRKVRRRVVLSEDRLLEVVLIKLSRKGWIISDWEKNRFRENIRTLVNEINAPS